MTVKLPFWIKNGICMKEELAEDSICNLGYACDGCPYNLPKPKSWHEYGTIGKPIFICSKNFNMPTPELAKVLPEKESEPCGIHQADIWCIINGNVCPHLIIGMHPDPLPSIEEEIQEIRDRANKMIEDARNMANEVGWSFELMQKMVRGYSIINLYNYNDDRLANAFAVYDDEGRWERSSFHVTWEEFIETEFKNIMGTPSIKDEIDFALERASKMRDHAIRSAKEKGWEFGLKEFFVKSYAVHDLYAYNDDTLSNDFHAHDTGEWDKQNEISWEDFIEKMFKELYDREQGNPITHCPKCDGDIEIRMLETGGKEVVCKDCGILISKKIGDA